MTKKKGFIFLLLAVVVLCFYGMGKLPKLSNRSVRGQELIGTKALEWSVQDWFHSEPLQLQDLKGKVILVRFWTGPECPYCRATAPALNEFYRKYHDHGLVVIGFYHHKSPLPLDKNDVKKLAEEMGFQFPVAIDYDWKTFRKWWLDKVKTNWTSISFLIDKKGVIRHVHPGGQYVKGDQDYVQLTAKIEELLKESE